MLTTTIIQPFINKKVIVKAESTEVHGVLVGADTSKHNGIGNLVLLNSSWVIVRRWRIIRIA